MHTTTRNIDVCEVDVVSTSRDFHQSVEVSRGEKNVLLNLKNPNYVEMIQKYNHMLDVEMQD